MSALSALNSHAPMSTLSCLRVLPPLSIHTSISCQPSLLVEQADQVDLAAGAAIKGVCSEPQQPQLPRLRMFLQEGKGGDAAAGAGGTGAGSGSGSACRVVLLVEESAVRGSMATQMPHSLA